MKKISLFLIVSFCVSTALALDCQDADEKFVKVDAPKVDTSMYDKKLSVDKIESVDYKSADGAYTSGRWSLKSSKDDNLNVMGVSICNDSDENLDFKNIKKGNYCWCNIESIDTYRVSSKWRKGREFKLRQFDETKYTNKQEQLQQKIKEDKGKKIQECMDNCAKTCQEKYATLIHRIDGFYVCGKSLYKIENARCVVDNKFINAKSILVFDDIADIQLLGGGSIILSRENENKFDYVGEYESGKVYLKVKNGGIYVGRKASSVQECL